MGLDYMDLGYCINGREWALITWTFVTVLMDVNGP